MAQAPPPGHHWWEKLPGFSPSDGAESTPLDVTQLLAGTTAVVGVLASLAVTGVLGQAQRNHPGLIYTCLGFVLAAALLWSWASIVPGRRHPWLYLGGVAFFAVGLTFGVIALVTTQKDSERPSVSATFDKNNGLVTATITADGLSQNKTWR